MHAVSSGRLMPYLPASDRVCTPSTSTSSVWRQPNSTFSSPGLSDSKDEEDMDIDPDEYSNSPRTDLVLQQTSGLLAMCKMSDLYISEQNTKHGPMLTKCSQSFQLVSGEKTPQSTSALAYSAMRLLSDCTNDDTNRCASDATQVASSGTGAAEKEQLAVALLSEMNSGSQAHGTVRSDSLPQGQHQFCAKSFVFVSLLVIFIAVFISYVLQTPATRCVDHIDVESLRRELQQRVHGQHIAVNVVISRLEEFMSTSDRRHLVMSFHGWTGIGKNFMSSIIAQHLPSTNVHKFIVPLHFAHGTDSEALLLSEWILSNMSYPSCGLQLFIIDEIDKTPGRLMPSFHETLNRLSLRTDIHCRAVFLLLANDGATEINTVVTKVLMNGGAREDLKLEDLVPRLSSVFYSELSSRLIDQMVPFLPLERRHVALCTEAELKQRQVDITQQLVDNIVNNLSYFPANVSLFSSSGCRRIAHLVDLFL